MKYKLMVASDYKGNLTTDKIPKFIEGKTEEEKIAKWIAFYKAGIAIVEEH